MLSVNDSAKLLGVSSARIRALIKSNKLPAIKYGREWLLKEEDVLQRLSAHPQAGRPRNEAPMAQEPNSQQQDSMSERAHEAYRLCREIFKCCPSKNLMSNAKTMEEASFYMAVSTFFLQEKQAELVDAGVY